MECRSCHTTLPSNAAYCQVCGSRQPHVAEPDSFEYAAFISYRHLPRDQEVAMRVQRAIETYRLPKGLKAHGAATDTRTLGKCFRDEDELPAAHSLPDRITDALAKSRTFIVICTPETPNSPWVLREVETYAQLHGRERIFAVLADGDSEASIPELLKTRLVTNADGTTEQIASGPLAADMRPTASDRVGQETLRIIASVAGCGFDDLRQRERSRKRKRFGLIAAGIIALAIVIAAFAFAAHSAQQSTLISESERLAGESSQLLMRGDRYGAIETALVALPRSSNDTSRPLVPEAQQALESALQIHATPDTYWRADYSIQTAHPLSMLGESMTHETGVEPTQASAIAIDELRGILAISDDDGDVVTYDVRTGRQLARCAMPASALPLDDALYVRTLAAANGHVVVSNAGKSAVTTCFEADTGTLLWQLDDVAFPTMSVSNDGEYLDALQPLPAGGFATASIHVENGELVAVCNLQAVDSPAASYGTASVIGKRIADYYVTVGNMLVSVDQATSASSVTELLYYQPTDLECFNGTLVAASTEPIPPDSTERQFAVEAFDANLTPLWEYDGILSSQMMVYGNLTTLLEGAPKIAGFAMNGTQVALAAGRQVVVLDAASGAELLKRDMNQTVVAAQVLEESEAGICDLIVACSDGTVTLRDLTGANPDVEGDALRLELPFPIRWAHACLLDDRLTILAAPADATDRIVAYHTDFTHGEELGSSDLDTLIALADDVLAKAGR